MPAVRVSAPIVFGAVMAVLLLAIAQPARAGNDVPRMFQSPDDWPMYGASASHLFANAGAPPPALGLVWDLAANGVLSGSSAVEDGDFVYLADTDTTPPPTGPQLMVYKVKGDTGSRSDGWSALVDVAQNASLSLGVARGVPRSLAVSGGFVYVLFTAGNATENREALVALDAATGVFAWGFAGTSAWPSGTPAATRSAPVLGSGLLAFGSQDGNVYALNPATGALVWWCPVGAPVQTVPAIVEDIVYVVAGGSDLLLLDVGGLADGDGGDLDVPGHTGDILHVTDLGVPTISSPVVSGAYVYVDVAGDLVKIDRVQGGAPIWTQATAHETDATPAVAGNLIVTRRTDGRLYAYDAATGQIEWVRGGMAAPTDGGDLAVADGRVFLGAQVGTTYDLVALDASDGTILFRNTTARPALGAPVVAGDKILVTQGRDLLAFRGQPDLVPDKVAMLGGVVNGNFVRGNVSVTVRNVGEEPVWGVRVRAYDGVPGTGVLLATFTVGNASAPLKPNAITTYYTADRDWTVKAHDVWVVIDRALTEENDANNARAFPIYVQPGPPPPPVVLGVGPYVLALLGGFGIGVLVLWFPLQRLRELRRKEPGK